jgi:two-component system sensor histidine kinase RpfC
MDDRVAERCYRQPPDARPTAAIARLAGRLQERADSEHEQALIRIVIVGLLILLFLGFGALQHADQRVRIGAWLAIGYFAVSVVYLIAIIVRPRVSPTRRLCAMTTDLATTSAFMHFGGEAAAPFYAIYLWVTFGNGFRYGVSYLAIAVFLAASGFLVVILTTEFWRAEMPLGLGLLAALIILPGYCASLIRKLRDAKQQADAANLAKSRFLATMSHELRTPLNAIIGTSELLTSTRLDADQEEMVHAIRSYGGTLLSMIDNILDLSKIEAEKLAIIDANFDVHRSLADIFVMFRAQAASQRLALLFFLDAEVPRQLRGDAARLQQILINLISNALKFTEQGRVVLSVEPTPLPASLAVGLKFRIEDTGIGISPAEQATIFDRFAQAQQTRQRGYSGSGLGLAISRGLAQIMGGTIRVESQVRRGSTFTVDIPFVRPLAMPPEVLPEAVIVLGATPFRDFVNNAVSMVRPSNEPPEVICVTTADTTRTAIARRHQRQVLLIDMRCEEYRLAASALTTDGDLAGIGVVLVVEDAVPCDTLSGVCAIVLRVARWGEVAEAKAQNGQFTAAMIAALRAAASLTHVSGDECATVGPRAPHATGLRVLVAEDNPVNQKVTRRLVERAGHAVVVVDNGEDALEALEQQAFDAFIVDINMARMGGLDAVKLYRMGSLGQPRLPIIALTADATADTRRAAEEAGVDVYLTKPVEPRRLLETLAIQCHRYDPQPCPVPPEPAAAVPPSVEPIAAHPRYRQEATPAIDWSAIDSLAQYTDNEFVIEALEEYQDNAERLVDQIAEAIRLGDTERLRERLHALRGTSGNIGATAMCRLCREYQEITDQRLAEAGPAILWRLQANLQKFRQDLAEGVELLRPSRRG